MVKIINQSYKILTKLDGLIILKNIERSARTCYKSEHLITEDGESAKKLCRLLVERGHTAMLEFGGMITVLIICNRGLTHELVRHRIASYAQESTRYCDYTKDKHRNEITVILPLSFELPHTNGLDIEYVIWKEAMINAEKSYFKLRSYGLSPQISRGVLPIDIKTEINISANLTQWRHIFQMRTSEFAHPQIRTMMRNILDDFKEKIPILFDDINPKIHIDRSVLESD